MKDILLKTKIGNFLGNDRNEIIELLNIKYASCKRFEYAEIIDKYDEVDARKKGPVSMQKRAFPEYEHLEVPERFFYHKEFREGIDFTYSEEDGLNLNIYMPKDKSNCPVIVFFPGGGFDSGGINESCFDAYNLAKKGNVIVLVQYRVGIFGYLTHEEIYKKYGRDGNFGLDDMVVSLKWVRKHIEEFNGDKNNITLMGQSAGAMSIQYLLCDKSNKDLFDKAILLSGGGLFPKFSLPRPYEKTREYWQEVISLAGLSSFEELKTAPAKVLLGAVDQQKTLRKDNTYNTMPVIDNYLIKGPIDKLIKDPIELPLIIGYTNNDMFTVLLANISTKYAKKHHGYLYYFDVDAKGDDNQAFHSAELRYIFGTLDKSWRPYDEKDHKISEIFMDYITQFALTGNPNKEGLPTWDIYKNKPLRFNIDGVGYKKPKLIKLIKNTLKGDPK